MTNPAYRIRWRLPSFFLGLLLLSSAVDVGFGARRQFKPRPEMPAAVDPVRSTVNLQTRLEATSDPVELRRIALERHQAFLSADRVVDTAVPAVRALNRASFTRGIWIFLLALCIYFFDFQPRAF